MGIYQKHGIDAQIDDEMLPIIQALNDLGSRTKSCCSGHGHKKAQLAGSIKNCDVFISNNDISINWDRKL